MTDTVTGDASRPQPAPVDLSGIDPHHPDQESPERLLATTIAETASGVTGVHHLGGLAARTLDRARRQVLGTSSAPGVTVSSEGLVTVVDLDIVVEYPHAIDEVIENARTQVSHAARQITSGPVSVNVAVTDIHGPFDQDPAVLDAIDTAGDAAREVGGRVRDRARDAAAAAGSLDAARAHVDGALYEARRDVDEARLEVDEARLEVDRALDADVRGDAKRAVEADRPTDEAR